MVKVEIKSFSKSPRVLIRMYNEKAMFPISGKGYVVTEMKLPTMRTGSMTKILKRFKTKKDAMNYFNKLKGKYKK